MKISQLLEQHLGSLTMKEINALMLKVITPLKMASSDKIEFQIRGARAASPEWEPGRIDIKIRTKRSFEDEKVLLKAAINSLLRTNFPWLEVGSTSSHGKHWVFYLRVVEEHRADLVKRFKSGPVGWAVEI